FSLTVFLTESERIKLREQTTRFSENNLPPKRSRSSLGRLRYRFSYPANRIFRHHRVVANGLQEYDQA
ncbi:MULTISPECIES: hypothetical protein, partial [Brevibacillus]|uniref:hypothetical protein n=1 Tax=Brevibacillus TaxID=55080 RepID=UPI001ED92469